MTIVRVGTNKKYSDGWDSAFGGKRKSTKSKSKKKVSSAKAVGKSQGKRKKSKAKKS